MRPLAAEAANTLAGTVAAMAADRAGEAVGPVAGAGGGINPPLYFLAESHSRNTFIHLLAF
jgi:hypothetical protein